jgi:hypothetical protein
MRLLRIDHHGAEPDAPFELKVTPLSYNVSARSRTPTDPFA